MGTWLPKVALLGWLGTTVAIGAATTALHESPLPLPSGAPRPEAQKWRMVHALAGQCPCSLRLVDHLVARGSLAGVEETALLVGADEPLAERLRSAGFRVLAVDEAALAAEHGFTSVPALQVVAPDGAVAYRGAHRPLPTAPPADQALLAEAIAGHARAPMAVLGCAVSRSLQDRLDPLDLKYARWRR